MSDLIFCIECREEMYVDGFAMNALYRCPYCGCVNEALYEEDYNNFCFLASRPSQYQLDNYDIVEAEK